MAEIEKIIFDKYQTDLMNALISKGIEVPDNTTLRLLPGGSVEVTANPDGDFNARHQSKKRK